MGWATPDDVFDLTGREASPESLAAAQTMIELFSGTTTIASDEELIASKNLRLLQQAVAWQAVWLEAHPDALEAMDVTGVSQDGLSATYANANAHLLAPLATRCLNRLSWRRQIRIGRGNWARRRLYDRGNRDSAVRDDQYEWSPMPFGSTPSHAQSYPGGH
jgi:hypothetical protein